MLAQGAQPPPGSLATRLFCAFIVTDDRLRWKFRRRSVVVDQVEPNGSWGVPQPTVSVAWYCFQRRLNKPLGRCVWSGMETKTKTTASDADRQFETEYRKFVGNWPTLALYISIAVVVASAWIVSAGAMAIASAVQTAAEFWGIMWLAKQAGIGTLPEFLLAALFTVTEFVVIVWLAKQVGREVGWGGRDRFADSRGRPG